MPLSHTLKGIPMTYTQSPESKRPLSPPKTHHGMASHASSAYLNSMEIFEYHRPIKTRHQMLWITLGIAYCFQWPHHPLGWIITGWLTYTLLRPKPIKALQHHRQQWHRINHANEKHPCSLLNQSFSCQWFSILVLVCHTSNQTIKMILWPYQIKQKQYKALHSAVLHTLIQQTVMRLNKHR